MKKEYKTPLTEVVYINIGKLLQDEYDDTTQDSTGTIPGDSDDILTNESQFDDDMATFQGSKSLWDD